MNNYNLSIQNNFSAYNRLLTEDIQRLPTNSFYMNTQRTTYIQNTNKHNNGIITKSITIASFALMGLYIAHRNNLFNPVYKEAKKIIKNQNTFEQINNYVSENFNSQNCMKFIKRFLNNLTNDKNHTKGFSEQAKLVYNNPKEFDKLFRKVFAKLNDDPNTERLKKGFSVDIIDNFYPKLINKLEKLKENKVPYKNIQPQIISELFQKDTKGIAPIEDMLYNVVTSRVKNTIVDSIQAQKTLSKIAKLA